jgi:endoglucanase
LEEGALPCEVTFVWSVQEEVGARGAGPAVSRVDPDFVMVSECTIAADFPGVPKQKVVASLLAGTVLTVMDRMMISDPRLVDLCIEVAKDRKLKVQLKKPGIGGTDAGPIHIRGEGYRALPLATPSRYIHSPAGIMDLRDVENTVGLIGAMLKRLSKGDV